MRRVTADLILNEVFKATKRKEQIEYKLRNTQPSNVHLVMNFNREIQTQTNRIFNLQNR